MEWFPKYIHKQTHNIDGRKNGRKEPRREMSGNDKIKHFNIRQRGISIYNMIPIVALPAIHGPLAFVRSGNNGRKKRRIGWMQRAQCKRKECLRTKGHLTSHPAAIIGFRTELDGPESHYL